MLWGAVVGVVLGTLIGVFALASLRSDLCGAAPNCEVSGAAFVVLSWTVLGLLAGFLLGLLGGLVRRRIR
jgi:hypothetical protein